MPVQVRDGKADGFVVLEYKEDSEGEAIDDGSPNIVPYDGKLAGRLLDPFKGEANRREKSVAQPQLFIVIPNGSFQQVELGLRPETERSHALISADRLAPRPAS